MVAGGAAAAGAAAVVDRVHYHVIGISLVMSMRWFISYWWNDYYVEYIIGITILEQESLLVGFKLFILSEWMLFVGGFGAQLNWMFNMNVLYSLNLLNYFTFSLASSNLLILIFSSFSIQSCIIVFSTDSLSVLSNWNIWYDIYYSVLFWVTF